MKYLLMFFLLVNLSTCEERFGKEKYDVSLHFTNTTSETVELSVNEVNNKIKWDQTISPSQTYEIKFNIKKDIISHEGGFIYKAKFANGETIEENTGYFTNHQFQAKNPSYIDINKSGFKIK